MKADGKYPEGFRVKGWFRIEPGKRRTFSAENDIYVRVAPLDMDSRPFKPANATQGTEYSFQVKSDSQLFLTKENSFTTVESSEGQVIYSSTDRKLLVRKDGFYEFNQNSTFKVSGDGRDADRRAEHRKDLANASTYSCTALATFSPTPVPTRQNYTDKQYGDKGTGQAVTNKTVVDVEKAAVTTKDDLWTRADTVSSVDDMVDGPLILTVKFLDTGSEFFSEEKAEKIERIASVWSLHGNIKFKFVRSGPADFSIRLEPRIATDKNGRNSKR